MVFNGFEVFENKLKPETKGAIATLKSAQIGCVMITGDNTLTGSNISYKCDISDKTKGMIICDYVDSKFTEEFLISRKTMMLLPMSAQKIMPHPHPVLPLSFITAYPLYLKGVGRFNCKKTIIFHSGTWKELRRWLAAMPEDSCWILA